MTQPQLLTATQVKKAGLEAYNQQRQHPDNTKRQCVYQQDDLFHCVVGAALDPETLAFLIEPRRLHDDRATQSLFFNDPEHPEVLDARNRLIKALQP